MTITPEKAAEKSAVETVTLTVDGIEVTVPKGTLVIRAAEELGIAIPRFCDHPLLEPVGACRQCIVEVEGQRKPVASCTTTVADGMVVKTQRTSEVADKAQAGTMELLLINHPLDCPVCDKGGECPLQNQAMSAGRPDSRFYDVKRTFPKPLPISSEILLDRERCVLCARCTRFSQQIAGDPFIELFERGALEQVAIYEDEPFESYFSGNTTQICPVGALTSTAYRFRARPFDLVSTPSVCEHCSSGCAQRTDWRRGKVMRRLAGEDPEVNEEWNCDKGRFAFTYAATVGRITTPLVRNENGELQPASWTEALDVAAEGLREARDNGGGVGVLAGGRLTFEDAYAYSKFARLTLQTNDIDFRARPHSDEEAQFLAASVAGVTPASGGVTYAALESSPMTLLVGFEPEEESPIVFLRLRKAVKNGTTKVAAVAPLATRGLSKLSGTLIQTMPGSEPKVLDVLSVGGGGELADISAGLREPGAVIMVGERLASVPGALSAVSRLAASTGAKLAWVPRRAGERGALRAGLLPGLLPGEFPVTDAAARETIAQLWGVQGADLPDTPGRSTEQIVAAAGDGSISALIVAGVDTSDLPDPAAAERALAQVGFVVSFELRESAVTSHADVVFPVAPAVEKSGCYLNWEGRERPFAPTLSGTGALTDAGVLSALAAEIEEDLGLRDIETLRAEWRRLVQALDELPRPPAAAPEVLGASRSVVEKGQALLVTWHHLIDDGALLVGEEHLAGTAPKPLARLSAATAAEVGVKNGDDLMVFTDTGHITLPLAITEMPDRVVWLPTKSPGSHVRETLTADTGTVVHIGPISMGANGVSTR